MFSILFLIAMIDGDVFFTGAYDQAVSLAGKQSKYVMVDVYAEWCGPCKLMDRKTFTDKVVKEYLSEKFVSIKIDAEKGEGIKLARKWRVIGYPTMIIIDKKGKIVAQQPGYMDARQFLSWLKRHTE